MNGKVGTPLGREDTETVFLGTTSKTVGLFGVERITFPFSKRLVPSRRTLCLRGHLGKGLRGPDQQGTDPLISIDAFAGGNTNDDTCRSDCGMRYFV